MKLSRRSRFFGALVALVSMLFMQLAIAGYVCPNSNVGPAAAETVAMPMDMVGCEKMDPILPNLCHASAQGDHQSLDKPKLPHVQPFVPNVLTLVLQNPEEAYRPVSAQPDTVVSSHAASPPLSIRYCCFRL